MTLVPIAAKQHGDTIKLKMADGNWREFWVVRKTSEGIKVLDKTEITKRYFDPERVNKFNLQSKNNIAYFLNNEYYNSLHEDTKKMLINATWQSTVEVNAYVGLLSVNEWSSIEGNTHHGGKIPYLQYDDEMTITPGNFPYYIYGVYTNMGHLFSNLYTDTRVSVRPSLVLDSTVLVSEDGAINYNSLPTVTIDGPTQNQTLYENDTLNITGTASDADNGNAVTIRYQVNASTPRAIKAFVSTGAAEAFGKNLTFRGGNLYDGDTLIATGLVDGVPHTLKVWATDDPGGTSPIVERTFYVVPNRTPLLTVNTPVIDGLIDSDEIEFSGEFSDPDNNEATVSYRINGGNSVQVAQGISGSFDFKIKFGQLKVGLNNIVIEVIDSYGAKTSKTVKLQKDEVSVAQLKSTARYKIKPPLGTASGVVVWVQRDEGLSLDAKISMTAAGEAESFVPMTKSNTAPMPNQPGIVEDQFQYEHSVAVDTVILQLDLERSSLTANEKIHAIVGVID